MRYLWPEMLRAISEIQPPWVVGENVSGLVNWDGGLVFEQVQADLEAKGYEVVPFLLPAAGVEAPHERERIWFVAYSKRHGLERDKAIQKIDDSGIRERVVKGYEPNSLHDNGVITDTNKKRLQGGISTGQRSIPKEKESFKRGEHSRIFTEIIGWDEFPTQSPICVRDDGVSSKLDGITFSEWRIESIKSTGNSIAPKLALQIFKAIEIYESNL